MAYLILAHEDENQLDALIDVLVPPGSPDVAIVHADRRSALWNILRRRPADPDGRMVLVPDPVAVRWGHHGQIEAIAKLVAAAVRAGCDYAHLISGADWPIAPREQIVAEITRENGLCHLEARAGHLEERMQTFRFDTRWLRLDPQKDRRTYAVTWELRRLARWFDAARRHFGLERPRPWGEWRYGSQWWSLPADALGVLARELPRLIASGRLAGTICADEHVVPTIIAHAFPGRLADNRRFIDFPPGASSPRVLDASHRSAILASGAWFMRKVSRDHSPFFEEFPVRPAEPLPDGLGKVVNSSHL
ncbi:beta-1,6-N-acetylglucosaminyltransferase [Novosphingobium mangrovi (ex Huang et al. 2023)]|uniref:Glycosyl transferase n=1 Tax=Novosphingobium mangrovi (ex Huang et al. 2023) TaxID=2976432 RepID=A0ABT2I5P3_9SPHN|nr:beta-1,6-N-acetylglucosaminyltransferase [Novosphingobium mangrovi (ex Huang et al. 2023)]MCT2400129.1 glycosyl transferase [Novosphingobium mangrovi (ex Huang et al. 2023)]